MIDRQGEKSTDKNMGAESKHMWCQQPVLPAASVRFVVACTEEDNTFLEHI